MEPETVLIATQPVTEQLSECDQDDALMSPSLVLSPGLLFRLLFKVIYPSLRECVARSWQRIRVSLLWLY